MTFHGLTAGRVASAPARTILAALCLGTALAAACSPVTEVVDAGVASVQLSPLSSTLAVGAQLPLQASIQDAAGQTIPGAAIHWSVRDPEIASVSSGGVVTGLAVGTTQVSANAGGQSAVAAITVVRTPVAAVDVRPEVAEVTVGGQVQFSATALDANQATLEGRGIIWSTSNAALATVEPTTGLATAVAAGTVTITATAEGKSDAATLTITAAQVATVEVSPDPVTMTIGQATRLTATPRDASGSAVPGRAVTWTSSNTAVAGVSDQGVVTGVAAGTATVTATVDGRTGTATVTVTNVAVGSVTVSPATATLTPRGSVLLAATVRDVNGAVATSRFVAWSSSNTAVATVSGTGLVTAVAPGTASITATSEGKSGAAAITVVPAPVASIEVSPPSVTVAVQQAASLSVTLRDADGFVLSGRSITFASANPAIATVSASGVVTGVAAGTTSVTVSSEGTSTSVPVTVTAAAVGSVTVQPATATIRTGQTTTLAAVVRDANGAIVTDRAVTWSSGNTAVATVSTDGVVTGVAPGAATITATSEGQSGTATVTVSAGPVGSVTVDPATTTIASGSADTLAATARDQAGAVVTGRTVTWISSDTTVATVSATGVVTGRLAGTATITATVDGVSGTSTVTVTAGPAVRIRISPATATLSVGAVTTLTAEALDAAGNVVAGVGFTWSSTDPSVAHVTGDGRVTAKKAGTVTISATGAGLTGTALVTVTP